MATVEYDEQVAASVRRGLPAAGRVLCAGVAAPAFAPKLLTPARAVEAVAIEPYAPPALAILTALRRRYAVGHSVDAVVVVGKVIEWARPDWLLAGIRDCLRPGSEVVLVTTSAPGVRAEIRCLLADAGFTDPFIEFAGRRSELVPWADAGRRVVDIDGRTHKITAGELEELNAIDVVVSTTVRVGRTAETHSVIAVRTDDLGAANAAARRAPGERLCFGMDISAGFDATALLRAIEHGATLAGSHAVTFDARATPGNAFPYPSTTAEVRAVTGGTIAISRALFCELGGFDERMGAFAAIDLSLRVRGRGLTVVHAPGPGAVDPPVGRTRGRRAFLQKWSHRLDEIAEPIPRSTHEPKTAAPLVVTARVFDNGGVAAEARSIALGLDAKGLDVRIDPTDWNHAPASARASRTRLDDLADRPTESGFIHLLHGDIVVEPVLPLPVGAQPRLRFVRHPESRFSIARVVFDTDIVPPNWTGFLNEMDDCWVPTRADTVRLREFGVDPELVHVIPEAIDAARFRRRVTPLRIPGAEGFTFLSICYPDHRKGLDVLLRAYAQEFAGDDSTTLVVKLSPALGRPIELDITRVRALLADIVDRTVAAPRVVLLTRPLTDDAMLRLYRAADAYVLPTRGEGWGRPYLEALVSGLPVIATGWGGQLEFLDDDNAYLVDYTLEAVDGFPGVRRAEPSVAHLRTQMRYVRENAAEGRARAASARGELLRRYDTGRVVTMMTDRLRERGVKVAKRPRPNVVWEGPQTEVFGMAVVNRELCAALRSDGLDVRIGKPANDESVTVRSAWPPDLSPVERGRLVLAQPWEYGSVPRAWVDAVGDRLDEVWVPSRFVRDCYLRSGVDPDRVRLVPYGVDPGRFRPDAPPIALPTDRSFRFLFVGGTIQRKGIDTLVDAYLEAFRPDDDVCLVIKDLGARTFYRGQGMGARIRERAADPANAPIVYLEDEISDENLSGLYTACNALVHPYRGEGYGLPIVEAMACGLPVVVPRYGPALDFCTDETAVFVSASEIWGSRAAVGEIATVANTWWNEVDRGALRAAMRDLAADPKRARRMGAQASEHARAALTWSHAARVVGERVTAVSKGRTAGRAARRSGPELSVCMIAKNAEALIESALASVENVADEIVVVDTGSQDRTIKIAQSFGADVHRRPWRDDFAAARNAAVELAHGRTILMLDSDMTLDPDSINELRCLAATELLWGFVVRQLNYLRESGDTYMEHGALRLFSRDPRLRYRGAVHEQLGPLDSSVPFQIVPCGVVLHHEGYRPQYRDGQFVATRDKAILERMVDEDPNDVFALFNLGMTCGVLGLSVESEQYFQRCVDLGSPRSDGMFPQYVVDAYIALAELDLAAQRNERAVAHAFAAQRLGGARADTTYLLGRAYRQAGNLREAQRQFQDAIGRLPANTLSPFDPATAGWKPLYGLAEIAMLDGKATEATALLRRAITMTDDPVAQAEISRLVQAATPTGVR